MRRGKITMSHAKELLTGGKGVTRATYLRSVATELVSVPDEDNYQSRDMVRGNELEPFARRAFELHTGWRVNQVGFVLADDERIGCSPDGAVFTTEGKFRGGLEIKSPRPANHLKYLDREVVAKEHGPQMQGSIWVCESHAWYFVSFCPWVKDQPLVVHTFNRDESVIEKLADSALRGADEVTEMAATFSDANQPSTEVQAIANDALEYWNSYEALSDEVQI